MVKLNTIGWIALIVLLIGGLTWGLGGFFGFNLVSSLFGEMSVLTRIVYCLVGIGALYVIIEGIMSASEARTHRARPA